MCQFSWLSLPTPGLARATHLSDLPVKPQVDFYGGRIRQITYLSLLMPMHTFSYGCALQGPAFKA